MLVNVISVANLDLLLLPLESDPGSAMGKNPDPGFGIQVEHSVSYF
jgi:hypothetical protein